MVYYTDHCPWTAKYTPFLEKIAGERGASVCFQKIGSKEEAQEAPSPFPTFSVYYNGTFVTNEIFSGKKFIGFLEGKGF